MHFTLEFLEVFFIALFYTAPILIFLLLLIVLLGVIIGKKEGWSTTDAVYYAFITATTVGYGDFHPKTPACKRLAVAIALIGLILTGLVVSIGVHAGSIAFKSRYTEQQVMDAVDDIVAPPASGGASRR